MAKPFGAHSVHLNPKSNGHSKFVCVVWQSCTFRRLNSLSCNLLHAALLCVFARTHCQDGLFMSPSELISVASF